MGYRDARAPTPVSVLLPDRVTHVIEIPDLLFRSDVTVELVRAGASDADVAFAARVSTVGEQSLDDLNADPASN